MKERRRTAGNSLNDDFEVTNMTKKGQNNTAIKALRIGYFADGPWAHESLKMFLKNDSIHICFVCLRFDKQDDALRRMAEENGIEVICHPSVNSQQFLDIVSAYNADLFVSMSFNQIFKKEILSQPPMGIINCHAGKLPFYRGRNVLNWALINDEKEFGITVHFVDEGIDTGDIILQKSYPITDEDTYKSLLERAYVECAVLLNQAVLQLMNGTVTRIPQNSIDPHGTYCGIRTNGDEVINWNQNSRGIFNFVRAITKPGPGAISYINGIPIHIYAVQLLTGLRDYINTPGQVIGKTAAGFLVKTTDTFVEITDYEYTGRVKIGDRLKPE